MAVQGTIPKQPAETFPISYTFKRLGSGETIVTPTVTSKRLSDSVDTTATFLSGSPSVGADGATVTIRVVAGADGETHRVEFRVVTSVPNTYEGEIDVKVKSH